MTVRKLNLTDVFKMSRLIKKSCIKDQMLTAFKKIQDSGETSETELGIHYIFILIDILSNEGFEEDLYDLLAGPFNCSKEEVSQMELMTLIENLQEVASFSQWADFLKKAVPLTLS